MDEPIGVATISRWQATLRYLPSLVKAAGVTLVLSCLSMAIAVILGVLIASGRVYGRRLVRLALTGYVELMRGTPVLLQLFVIYYGLASVVRLPAFVAALAGLALNYAAYESEIYRGALEAVPPGQLEAARTLGLTERQVLRLVRGPQAFRLALAPMTNDFVALLKDSSLVSVLTVVELTKQTQIFATNLGSWVIPGTLCAAIYLADVAAARRAGAPPGGAMEGADRMSADPSTCAIFACAAASAHDSVAAPRFASSAAARRADGTVRLRQDDHLRAIAGLERFDAGSIDVDGVTLDGGPTPVAATLRELRRQVGLVFQFHHLFDHLSALRNVTLAPMHVLGIAAPEAEQRARRSCSRRSASSIAPRAAARAVGRRSAARRDRARAGGRSAAADDGRAHGVARSVAAQRARRAAARLGRPESDDPARRRTTTIRAPMGDDDPARARRSYRLGATRGRDSRLAARGSRSSARDRQLAIGGSRSATRDSRLAISD